MAVILSTFFALVAAALVSAQDTPAPKFPAVPLAEKHFAYNALPYQASPERIFRGTQTGYNMCNSTTEGPKSMCQTMQVNGVDDFCLWAPSTADATIADTEGEEVAWCTKPGRGTRVIPQGALQGVQAIRTPGYLLISGFIDQTLINIKKGDYGGELDPHGADLAGNPMGGLVYSNVFGGTKDVPNQVIEWNNFMGGDQFCIKVCDPAGPNGPKLCEHVYDRIGCAYNSPAVPTKGVFESCLGDNQDVVGIYTQNGQVMTYTQPPEELGAITTMPYTPKVPASSSCTTFSSAAIYSGQPTASVAVVKSTATASPSNGSNRAASSSGSAGASPTGTSGASSLVMSSAALFGAVFTVLFAL